MSHHVARAIFTGIEHDPKWIFENITELPRIDDGEVLIRIRLATICESDIHTINGNRPEDTPLVLGHEAVGEIVEDRRLDMQPMTPGTRVTFSIISSCMKCLRCNRLQLPQKCRNSRKIGHVTLSNKTGWHGCYATHVILRHGTHIVSVPKHLSDRVVAPSNCALATMVNAVEKVRTDDNDTTALILGAGLHGIYGCALLKEAGYKTIYCSDADHNRLKIVSKFGGIPVHVDRFLEDDFLVDSVDIVIDVCGNPDVVQRGGYKRLRYGGALVFVGLVHPDSNITLTGEQIIRKCITIHGVHNYAPKHLDAAIDFLSKTVDKYPYEKLVSSHSYSLEEIDRATNETEKRLFHRSCLKP